MKGYFSMQIIELFKNSQVSENYVAGQIIFREGEPGATMFVVLEGKVQIQVNEQPVAVIEPGGIFGEMVLIDSTNRSATALAGTNCKIVPITLEQFNFMSRFNPYFNQYLMGVMANRLRRMNTQNMHGVTPLRVD
jgi:CRP/FNR family transcriptional regulator, cyclic AMP receptor protein